MASNQGHFEFYMYWSSFQCQKVRLALQIKNVDYSIRVVLMDKLENFDPDYLQINKNGTVPTLKNNNTVLCDPDEILSFLDEHFSPRLGPDPDTKDGQLVESLCEKINGIDIAVITKGAFLYPGLTKSSKVSAAFIKDFRGRFERKEKEKVLMRHLANNEHMKDIYEELLDKTRKFETTEFISEEHTLRSVKKASDVLNAIEDHLDELRAESGVETSWLCGDTLTLADILLTVTLFRLRCVGFSRATFEDGLLPLVDQYFEFAKSNMPGYASVCVNFKLDSPAENTKSKKGCSIL